jgi:hypothetical protein
MGCPGMGIVRTCPSETTPGNILFKALAAAVACHARESQRQLIQCCCLPIGTTDTGVTLNCPPSTQSASSNSDCRTGLENDTLPLSTNVMWRAPHPNNDLATLQPRVPGSRHNTHTPWMRKAPPIHSDRHTTTSSRTGANEQEFGGCQHVHVKFG